MRNATLGELAKILDWAALEGWNPGLEDAEAFFAADPGGFFVATDNETPVAAISVVNHSPDFAFLGLYIARPSHRGQGIGFDLWRHALRHAGDRTVGLDGVAAQQGNYARSGFEFAGETTRFHGRVVGALNATQRYAEASDVENLVQMEAVASGVRKPAYLTAWFCPAKHRKTLVIEDAETIIGAATVRRCRDGAKIGPLMAPDIETARALILAAAQEFDPDITIDVPETSAALGALCRELKFETSFSTARMYKSGAPAASPSHFAVTSLELG